MSEVPLCDRRHEAAFVLGQLAHPDALPHLTSVLADRDQHAMVCVCERERARERERVLYIYLCIYIYIYIYT